MLICDDQNGIINFIARSSAELKLITKTKKRSIRNQVFITFQDCQNNESINFVDVSLLGVLFFVEEIKFCVSNDMEKKEDDSGGSKDEKFV